MTKNLITSFIVYLAISSNCKAANISDEQVEITLLVDISRSMFIANENKDGQDFKDFKAACEAKPREYKPSIRTMRKVVSKFLEYENVKDIIVYAETASLIKGVEHLSDQDKKRGPDVVLNELTDIACNLSLGIGGHSVGLWSYFQNLELEQITKSKAVILISDGELHTDIGESQFADKYKKVAAHHRFSIIPFCFMRERTTYCFAKEGVDTKRDLSVFLTSASFSLEQEYFADDYESLENIVSKTIKEAEKMVPVSLMSVEQHQADLIEMVNAYAALDRRQIITKELKENVKDERKTQNIWIGIILCLITALVLQHIFGNRRQSALEKENSIKKQHLDLVLGHSVGPLWGVLINQSSKDTDSESQIVLEKYSNLKEIKLFGEDGPKFKLLNDFIDGKKAMHFLMPHTVELIIEDAGKNILNVQSIDLNTRYLSFKSIGVVPSKEIKYEFRYLKQLTIASFFKSFNCGLKNELVNLVENVISKNEDCYLYGPIGIGKSRVALDLEQRFGYKRFNSDCSTKKNPDELFKEIVNFFQNNEEIGRVEGVVFEDCEELFKWFLSGHKQDLVDFVNLVHKKRKFIVVCISNTPFNILDEDSFSFMNSMQQVSLASINKNDFSIEDNALKVINHALDYVGLSRTVLAEKKKHDIVRMSDGNPALTMEITRILLLKKHRVSGQQVDLTLTNDDIKSLQARYRASVDRKFNVVISHVLELLDSNEGCICLNELFAKYQEVDSSINTCEDFKQRVIAIKNMGHLRIDKNNQITSAPPVFSQIV